MDFANESYVRVYTRDTMTWKRLSWQARCVWSLLLRKLDRAGVLELEGLDPVEAVALATELPPEVVEEGLPKLIDRGVVEVRDDVLVAPRFLEAQECTKSDTLRSREYRERRRSQAMAQASQNVTSASRGVTPPSREITERHAATETSRDHHSLLCSALPSSADLTSAALRSESAHETDQSAIQVRSDIAGFNFVASLLGRDSFSVAPLGSFLSQYTWIGSRPAEERQTVAAAVNADPWCLANPQEVDAPHLQRRWQRYLRGPAKPVERKLEPSAQERTVSAKLVKVRAEYAALIKAAREARDDYSVTVLEAERDLRLSKIQAQAS